MLRGCGLPSNSPSWGEVKGGTGNASGPQRAAWNAQAGAFLQAPVHADWTLCFQFCGRNQNSERIRVCDLTPSCSPPPPPHVVQCTLTKAGYWNGANECVCVF